MPTSENSANVFAEAVCETMHGPRDGFLYKYCSVEKAMQIFKFCGVELNSVKNYNDPFEGMHYPVWPDNDVLRRHIEKTNPPDKWEEAYETAIRQKGKYPNDLPPGVAKLLNTFGVSCFSEARDNLLMWGHYAKGHQGVCVGFRYREVRDNPLRELLTIRLSRVKYSDDFPAWKIAANDPQCVLGVLYTKALCWEYEQEWRIAVFGAMSAPKKGDPVILEIPNKEAFSHVIFGVKSSAEDQDRLLSVIDDCGYDLKRMIVQKARIAKREYKLEFDLVKV